MTIQAVLNKIKRKAARSNDTLALEALDDAVQELEADVFLPWFLLSEIVTSQTNINDMRVPIPVDFIKGYENGELYGENDLGRSYPLYKKSLDELIGKVYDNEVQMPVEYALTNNYYRVFPVLARSHKLCMLYYKKSRRNWEDPDNVNVWLVNAEKLVVAKAAMTLMEATRDMKGMAIQEKVYATERNKLIAQNTERDEINQDQEFYTN